MTLLLLTCMHCVVSKRIESERQYAKVEEPHDLAVKGSVGGGALTALAEHIYTHQHVGSLCC